MKGFFMNNSKAPHKGEFMYLDTKKKKQLIIAALSMIMVAIICLTGIVIYHTQKSLFAVFAALASLPAAKQLVSYLIIMPYHSTTKELKDKLDMVRGDSSLSEIIYDAALSSTEKAMYAGVIFIKNGKIYSFTDYYKTNPKKNITIKDIEKHLKFIVDQNCNYSAIKVYDNESAFLSAVKSEADANKDMSSDEISKNIEMNKRIANQIKVYIF